MLSVDSCFFQWHNYSAYGTQRQYRKKVREDGGGWVSLEEFICKHTEAELSHGMCPSCVTKLYPEIARKIFAKREEHPDEVLPSFD
jgi:hypothetical protein